jgi:hypothetical protein
LSIEQRDYVLRVLERWLRQESEVSA